jgi:pantoate--beta-alanine ligase
MQIVRTVSEVRDAVRGARGGYAPQVGASPQAGRSVTTVGLVPTMGALHEGHASLLRRARASTDYVVVSVFVNPTQFNDPADLAAYPRDEASDAATAREVGVDLFFAPDASEMYPPGFATAVTVDGLSAPMEGAVRGPGHFRGVATVVAKLFNIVAPDVAYFGQKDAQQALIVRRMARDLDLPLRVEVCPTVREPDGLAMSSRNARLGAADRVRALALRRGLDAAEAAVAAGERAAATVARAGRDVMRAHGVEPEYFELVGADTLEPLDRVAGDVLIAVAARVGPVRLIDNAVISV